MLGQLSELQDADDPDLLARVIKLYLIESPKLVEKIRQAGESGDAPEIVRAAHSFKSSSANVGATRLAQLCADLELAAHGGGLDEPRRILAQIEAEHGRVQAALKAELGQSVAS